MPHLSPYLDPYIDSLPTVSHSIDPIITLILDSPIASDIPPSFPNSDPNYVLPHSPLPNTNSDLSVPTPKPSLVPIPTTYTDSIADPISDSVPLRKSTRITKAPAYLQDYKCSNVVHDQFDPSNPTIKSGSTSSTLGTKYPLSYYLDSSSLFSSYAHFYSLITVISKPKSYYEAIKDPKWQDAMAVKIAALESNQTWTLTPLPPHKKAIRCKWVYRGQV